MRVSAGASAVPARNLRGTLRGGESGGLGRGLSFSPASSGPGVLELRRRGLISRETGGERLLCDVGTEKGA